MSNISDLIERYLKELLAASARGMIEIRRNELAERFNCVPSQINYVLATRFTVEHGFLVESRRGGGGYVRILQLPRDEKLDSISHLLNLVGREISQQRAQAIIERLREEKLITDREYRMMRAVVDREVLRVGLPARDQLRALILRAMILSLLSKKGE
ncbi:transcriptional regulator CtsR [Desulfofundulus luciae]|uniref:Transcriptional regulator CtsR n=1 Tax=Desulfofundulus luciae TaxID=74702 RepID=A0ABU0B0G9_9FIRM|nr:CtsR family transcriptional regulator [Desulfofundulus luciae]MDQ0286219.1 transcriptional regulator CtsR [Desulfofundulus luciae]